jgi:hypothetical protein
VPEYVRLYNTSHLLLARNAFRQLFRNTISTDQPLRSGTLLRDVHYELTAAQYAVISAAAVFEGDIEAYLSYLGGYEDDDSVELSSYFELIAHFRFDLRLYPPRDFGEDWGRMAEHVIYSSRGTWGVMITLDGWGIAAGSQAFRSRLLESAEFAGSWRGVLDNWKDTRERLHGHVPWVPDLLANVYGTAGARAILANFGEPADRW